MPLRTTSLPYPIAFTSCTNPTHSTYIVIYAIAQPLLGQYVDRVSTANNGSIRSAITNIAGVQFTVVTVVVLAATFIPKGALSVNPQMLNDEALDSDLDKPDVNRAGSSDEDMKKHHHNGTVDDRRQSVTRTNVGINEAFQQDLKVIAEHEKTTLAKV